MKAWRKEALVFTVLMLLTSACSSSKTKEDEATDLIPASSEAGTDAVPAEGGDAAAAPGSTDLDTASLDNPSPTDTPPASAGAETVTPPAGSPIEPPSSPSVASSNPAPSTPEPTPPSSSEPSVNGEYTVQTGDTLMKIAFETYGDLYKWKSIYEANKDKISNPNVISAGTVLKIDKPSTPPSIERNGEKYMIKTGDTLGKISNSVYGTPKKWKKIYENNRQLIHDPNKIFAGFFLYYNTDESSRQLGSVSSDSGATTAAPAAPAAASAPSAPAPAAAAPAPAAPAAPAGGDAAAPDSLGLE